MKALSFLVLSLLFCIASFGQTVTPPTVTTSTFTLNSTAISLPGGKSTVPGTDTQMLINITPNFSLRDSNFVSPIGNGFQYFGAGFRYDIPYLSKALNNFSSNLNGLKFKFGVTGTVGIDRVTSSNSTNQHYGLTLGGHVDYYLNNVWSLGAEIEYAKFPGLNNNTAIAKFGPAVHF